MRKKAILILAASLLAGLAAFAATVKAIKSTRVNDYQLIVSCTNGRTPATQNVSGSIVVSCEGRQE
jgi:capsular polysaccharide biosynthesis protein